MVILSRSVSETTDGESRKRRRVADGGGSHDQAEGWSRDAHMALVVRVADLQADHLKVNNDFRQLRDINSALEQDIAKLKIQAVADQSKNEALQTELCEHNERHLAQLKNFEKQHAKEVTDLESQHAVRVKEMQDQIAKLKRVIAAWNA